jgi:hypothetical protein
MHCQLRHLKAYEWVVCEPFQLGRGSHAADEGLDPLAQLPYATSPPACTIGSTITSLSLLRQKLRGHSRCKRKQWETDALSSRKVHLDDGERVRGLPEVEQHPQEVIGRGNRCEDPHNGTNQVLHGRGLYQGGMQLKICPLHAAGSPFWLPPLPHLATQSPRVRVSW